MSPRRSMKQCILLFALCIIGILAKECGTVSQCELGCIDGLFYERNTPGTQTFVCSTSRRKSRNDWYIGYCGEFDATTFACASLSGELRCNKCMFEIRPGSSQDDIFSLWLQSCNTTGTEAGFSLSNPMGKSEAMGKLTCAMLVEDLSSQENTNEQGESSSDSDEATDI